MKTIKELEAIKDPKTYWERQETIKTLKDVLGLIDECELKEGFTIDPEELKAKIEKK